ncbi:glycosyltransferase [Peribacillus sp. NJ11]|uniref:glycosyltransferase family 2 protein n=1 Tax=Peribacillus TaxID=2675229 RepID=UPI0025A00864|nr:glycosyltransferase [Peribacillus sp. NJ11]MDM5221857.1 glycosyltransferase [Peribacillus sp. NJ11]
MIPKVSIIVPIYNVEKYLVRCLDSLVNQTFNEIEIILVNDGSTDNSIDIIEEFQKKYEFIEVINKINGGLSSARNAGIEKARGEFLLFIDSDDYIELNMVEMLYSAASTSNSEIAICKFSYVYSNNNDKEINTNEDYNKYKFVNNNQLIKLFLLNIVSGHAWNKLVKRELFIKHNIEFPYGKYYEDAPTMMKLFSVVNKCTLINDSLYNYLQREDSIIKSTDIKKVKDHLNNLTEIKNQLSIQQKNELNHEIQYFSINQLFYNSYLLSKIENKENVLEHKPLLKKNIKTIDYISLLRIKSLRAKMKIILMKSYTFNIWFKFVKKI